MSGADWDAVTDGSAGACERNEVAREQARGRVFSVPEQQRYDLGGELGRGGMGDVRTARDLRLGRDVAYKRVASHARNSGTTAARFAREARITAFLEHPAIVPVYDAGRDPAGEPFYTMRLVRGRTLGDVIGAAADMTARLRLLRHFHTACEAVAYAHSQGVIHRDLKPDNVLVGEFGETQVVDWGLARWRREGEAEAAPYVGAGANDVAPDATMAGTLLGTPAYMSPEQARGEVADARSDVFSLGVMLWRLVAGTHPLAGRSSDALIEAMRREPLPSLADTVPAAPRALSAIVDRALRHAPAERYPDAKALADDIARFLDGRMVLAHDYSPADQLRRFVRAWRAPLSVAVVALLVLTVGGVMAVHRNNAERRRADVNLARALVEKAADALAVDARAEAEVLAVESLARVDSPQARGVLAAYGLAPRPQMVTSYRLPTCMAIRPSQSGAFFACRTLRDVSLWAVTDSGPALRWRRELAVRDVAISEATGRVLVTLGRLHHSVLALEDGADVNSGSGLFADAGLEAATAGEYVLLATPGHSALLAPRELTATQLAVCPSDGGVVATLSHDARRVAVLCGDDLLRVLGARDHVQRSSTPIDFRHQSGVTAAAWLSDDKRVVLGARDGTVAEIDVLGHRQLHRARLKIGQVAALAPHPTRERVAVLGGRGASCSGAPRPARSWPTSRPQAPAACASIAAAASSWCSATASIAGGCRRRSAPCGCGTIPTTPASAAPPSRRTAPRWPCCPAADAFRSSAPPTASCCSTTPSRTAC